ncbi:MAG: PilT/PilU family type 4a pilus ATPase [Candidatus Ozemobacteraceae bacterium]
MKELSGLLGSSDENERKQAVMLLSKSSTPENIAICHNLAENDPHVDIRFLAKRALNLMQTGAKPAPKPELPTAINEEKLKVFLEGNEKERFAAIQYIMNNGVKTMLPLLIDRLNKEADPTIVSTLILAVGKLGTVKDFAPLLFFFNNSNSRIRASAVEVAGMLGATQAYPHVLRLLDDPDNRVRANAVIAIKNLGPANTFKVIKAMAESNLVSMKSSAAFVLRFFPEEKSLELLNILLAFNDQSVRNNALKTLEVFREKGIQKAKEILASLGASAQSEKETLSSFEKEIVGAPPAPAPVPHLHVVAHKDETAREQDRLPSDFIGSAGGGALGAHLKAFAIQNPPEPTPECSLEQILTWARTIQASDIHLSPGKPVVYRQFGLLKTLSTPPFNIDQTETILKTSGIESEKLEWFHQHGDIETVIVIPGAGRFRVTVMKHLGGCNITARVVPWMIRSFEDSGMPASCKGLINWAQGLILVTGPVGSGKTSTLSTFVEMINQSRHDHIITVERPIEIVFEPANCQISQREVGIHTLTQGSALKGALREDPDILVVSELRDLDSIQLAISAAETGHLVLGTMNTVNAGRTVSRITDSFAPEEQAMLQNMLSESLRGIVCQQLVPRKDGTGVVPAFEVLIVTTAVSNMIRKEGIHQLASVMTLGKNAGMVTMDQSLRSLVESGVISGDEAYARAESKRDFEKFLPKKA